jgi:hypothetical protein
MQGESNPNYGVHGNYLKTAARDATLFNLWRIDTKRALCREALSLLRMDGWMLHCPLAPHRDAMTSDGVKFIKTQSPP